MIKINDIYVFYSDLDFSVWRVNKIRKNVNEMYSRINLERIYLVDEFNRDMEVAVRDGYDKINALEEANKCRNKYGVIKRLFK